MKTLLRKFGFKKYGGGSHNEGKSHQKSSRTPNHYSSAQNVTNNPFGVGGAWQSSTATVNSYHRVQSYPGEDPTGGGVVITPHHHPHNYLIPPVVGYSSNCPQPGTTPIQLASSPDIVQGYNHSILNRKMTAVDESFSPTCVHGGSSDMMSSGVMTYNRPPSGIFGGAKEEHTPDLLSAGEQLQTIPFHSPLWMKRDFPSRSSMRRKAASGRRLPPDMNVRFTDFGSTLDSGCEEILTDSEVIRRKHGLGGINSLLGKFTEPSDVETDTQTDLESNHSGRRGGKKGKRGAQSGGGSTKFFSRHASLKIKGGKRRGEKPSVSPVSEQADGQQIDNGGRRASVPESKRSMTDTEQQFESEAENSVFNIGFSTSNLKFTHNRSGGGQNNSDNFKRLGSTGNLMRRPFTGKNSVPGCHNSENEMSDSARSVKKSASSDNFHATGIPSGGSGGHSVKHKVGQGLAHSSLISSSTSKSSRKQSKANTEDTMVSLFEAVEVCNLDKVVELLSCGAIRDINIPNEDDFTILDMATLLNFDVMAAELLKYGARENPKFMVKEMRLQHVTHLLKRCDSQIHSLVPALVTAAQGSASNSQKVAKETELRFWEWRQRLLAKMKACFELAKAPDPPSKVDISVVSPTSVKVTFSPPKNTNGSLVTRYKLSWSRARNFEVVEGEHIILDLRDLSFVIRGLSSGVEIFVRTSAANIKGFGNCQISSPPSATPSHWRDISNKERRCSGKKVTELSLMFEQVKYSCLSSSAAAANQNSAHSHSQSESASSSSPAKRSAIKHLLPAHPKFIKNLNKGVYLSCALYTPDDKVVVTSDDIIPTVEVDEGTPANISQDFHWFLKLSVVWDDIPTLCADLSSDSSNTSISFRAKLIQAVFSLQALLSWRDIGRVYHRVLRDNHGNMIFVLIGHLADNKCPNGSGVKLSALSKIINKRKSKLDQSLPINGGTIDSATAAAGANNTSSANINSSLAATTANMSFLDEFSALDMLFLDLEELIRFHQNQEASLKSGLYLTLLKAESSINTLNVQVPSNCPNMTTCVKIRENPHVSKEEWIWIYNSTMPVQYQPLSENLAGTPNFPQPQPVVPGLSPCQANFRRSLAIAAGKLFRKLAIKDDNGYRIHKDEIIEVNSDVTVIAMLPPEVTSVNKYSDSMNSNTNNGHANSATANLVPLTVQLFEFTHLLVYQHYITSAYCRLCCLTDTLTLVANYQIREAFTDEEMRVAKSRLEILNETADKTETIWHSMRWLLGILQQNRMSRNTLGVPLKTLLDISVSPENPNSPASNQGNAKRFASHSTDGGKLQSVPAATKSMEAHSPQHIKHPSPQRENSTGGNKKSGNISSKCLVLQVYPRFNCGLPRGTSVRVVVDSKATCKVVVQLVVSELNKAALNHNPLANWDPNPDLFQLCVIVGDNVEHSLPENLPLVSCSDHQQPNSVKYIVKLKTNANYFPKYSDI